MAISKAHISHLEANFFGQSLSVFTKFFYMQGGP